MAIFEVPDVLRSKSALFEKIVASVVHPLQATVNQLLYVSDYAVRQVRHLLQLLQEDDCQHPLSGDDYHEAILKTIPLDWPTPRFAEEIRYFRHRHLLRLLLRELAGLADTRETMAAWSDCADALILHTLHYSDQQLAKRYGTPCAGAGVRASMIVLAMGKLGGRELNISSDIDLIFAYCAAGDTDGSESISNQQYYSKVVQQFIQLLQNITADGFVFRVDLRLRPNGDSGPLVCSLASMEIYYQEQGRDWERYAMVKARLIGDSCSGAHDWFRRLITPFVYRRYVDFSVIESLRSMKAMIMREVQLNQMRDNIKNGRGGIREVEFIIQCLQLIRGGRLPQLQKQNAMAALHALHAEGLIEHPLKLQQAYLFLRQLENAIQMQNDQQNHALPLDAVKQAQLYMALGYENWQSLLTQLAYFQGIISQEFQAVLGKDDENHDEKRLIANQLASLWQGHIEETRAINLLASLGFSQPAHCYQMIYSFRHAPRCRRLTQAARLRLDSFMLVLLSELPRVADTHQVLLQVIRLLENIVGRSAYLALLTENISALQELLHWFAESPFITSLLVNQPFLLEVLIDQKKTWAPLSKRLLKQLLHTRLAHCMDSETEDDVLRQFKLSCWLWAARAELYGQCDAVRIGRFLAQVAEVIIEAVVGIACERLSPRYPDIFSVKSCFAIIAYGKLGSQDMNYDSDVDLVFLHASRPSEEAIVTRLTQKILHMLTMRSQSGVLYLVDTRLRPSGSAGLLVSHLDTFVEYQRTHAWTWEHQAILRARVLYANSRIKKSFNGLKKEVLLLSRELSALREEVQTMRAKIEKHSGSSVIKYMTGGLLDLEFLVQFLILAYPVASIARCTNMLAQLRHLRDHAVLTHSQFNQLQKAYRLFHRVLHQSLLQATPIASDKEQADVVAISRLFYLIAL